MLDSCDRTTKLDGGVNIFNMHRSNQLSNLGKANTAALRCYTHVHTYRGNKTWSKLSEHTYQQATQKQSIQRLAAD